MSKLEEYRDTKWWHTLPNGDPYVAKWMADAAIAELEAATTTFILTVGKQEAELEELAEMLDESYFFLLNPDHPVTVSKRAEIAAMDEEGGRQDWRDYLREEAQQPYFGPNMQPPAWWSARREAEATVKKLTWMVEETWGQGGMEYGPPDFSEYMADLERRWAEGEKQ